jgi:hypothetical protein
VRAGVEVLTEEHGRAGLEVGASTAVPHWGGERADYNYLLMVLEQCDERAITASMPELSPGSGDLDAP